MSPLILILPLRVPISAEEAVSIGMSFATGLPCLVITMPSGPTSSRMERHFCLNSAAPIVFMDDEGTHGHKLCPVGNGCRQSSLTRIIAVGVVGQFEPSLPPG